MRELGWILAAATCLAGCSGETEPEPDPPEQPVAPEALLPASCGHAHNDYEHARPLLDAVELGFCSIEVDIFLQGEALLVAHDEVDLDPARTLQSLYLDPLRTLHEAGELAPPATGETLILLVDVKTDAEPTYAALDPILAGYDDILTRFEDGDVYPGPVTALISGNRDEDTIVGQARRFAAIDGRLNQLEQGIPLDVMPLVSASWTLYFDWTGTGDIPAEEQTLLDETVASVHAEGRRMRYWASPDLPTVWQTLLGAEADLVNTDDLSGFADFHSSP